MFLAHDRLHQQRRVNDIDERYLRILTKDFSCLALTDFVFTK